MRADWGDTLGELGLRLRGAGRSVLSYRGGRGSLCWRIFSGCLLSWGFDRSKSPIESEREKPSFQKVEHGARHFPQLRSPRKNADRWTPPPTRSPPCFLLGTRHRALNRKKKIPRLGIRDGGAFPAFQVRAWEVSSRIRGEGYGARRGADTGMSQKKNRGTAYKRGLPTRARGAFMGSLRSPGIWLGCYCGHNSPRPGRREGVVVGLFYPELRGISCERLHDRRYFLAPEKSQAAPLSCLLFLSEISSSGAFVPCFCCILGLTHRGKKIL